MKIKSISLGITAFLFLLISCGESKKSSETSQDASDQKMEMKEASEEEDKDVLVERFQKIDKKFKEELHQALVHYMEFKNSLVASDSKAAQTGAGKLAKTLASIDLGLLKGDEEKAFAEEHIYQLHKTAESISKAETIKEQRKDLDSFSEQMFTVVKAFDGGEGSAVYYQYCPMANNNKGGHWISMEEEIRNPYYGEKMLTCGKVKAQLASEL